MKKGSRQLPPAVDAPSLTSPSSLTSRVSAPSLPRLQPVRRPRAIAPASSASESVASLGVEGRRYSRRAHQFAPLAPSGALLPAASPSPPPLSRTSSASSASGRVLRDRRTASFVDGDDGDFDDGDFDDGKL